MLKGRKFDLVVGIESRGFIIATALAIRFEIGLVVIRKAGKLPGDTIKQSYKVEYGSDIIEMQISAIGKDLDVLIADDLIATGDSYGISKDCRTSRKSDNWFCICD